MNPLLGKPLLTPASTLAASAALLALAPLLGGSDVTVPNTFQAGTAARADEVNENFQALASAINDIPRPTNRIVVDHTNGDFDSVAQALDSITDADAENPYVVAVAPGVYVETAHCVVPAFVSLVGQSAAATTITASIVGLIPDGSAVVELKDLSSLRGLTVENTGTGSISTAIFGRNLSEETRISDCVARTAQPGGLHHYGVYLDHSDAVLVNCVVSAEGAGLANVAITATGLGSPLAQPRLIDCVLSAKVAGNGVGLQLISTQALVQGCTIEGWLHGISSSGTGINRVRDCEIRTQNLSPVYEQSGVCSIYSATTQFTGGNAVGTASKLKYVHCFKSNYDAVVNGTGSSVQ